MLFYELLEEIGKKGVTESTIAEAYARTFGKRLEEGEADRIILRLQKEAEKSVEQGQKKGKRQLKRSFATEFSKYLSGLSMEQLCFLVADYNPVLARRFYREADKWDVVAAAKEKISFLAESANVQFESVLFGMGGGYKGHGANDNVFDMTEDPKAASASLKKLGLM